MPAPQAPDGLPAGLRLRVSGRSERTRDPLPAAKSCTRDISGRIARSSSARRAFRSYNPCPATGLTTGPCTGYVIDHIQALKHRGADSPDNMQWQTREEAKAKDKLE